MDPPSASSPPANTTALDISQPPLPSSSPNTTNNSIVLLNIPISTKLNSTNYFAWKSQIEPLLYGYGLHRFLSPPAPNPTITIDGQDTENPAQCQDQFLLAWLRSSLSDTLLGQVVSCRSSSDLWLHLQQTFSATSRARLAELRRNLQTTVKGGSSCTDYLSRIRSIADELSFIGHPVSDEDLILYTLGGLGADFNSFVVSVTTKDHLSLSELHALLLSHEARLQTQLQPDASPSAFAVSTPRPNKSQHTSSRPPYRPPGQQ